MAITDEKCIAFTTYKKDGTAVTTPVWIVPLEGDKFGFYTSSDHGKAKRLKNNPNVVAQPSNMKGKLKPGSTPVEGTAEVFDSGPLFDDVHTKIKSKYGFQATVARFLGVLGGKIRRKPFHYADRAVVVTPKAG